MQRQNHALVLSGGGSYAAYEVGVIKALTLGRSPASGYRPIEPGICTGTSAGAFSAAFLASQWRRSWVQSLESLESIWLERIADHQDGRGNGVFRYRVAPFEILNPFQFARDPRRCLRHLIEDSASLTESGILELERLAEDHHASLPRRLAESIALSAFISTAPFEKTIRETIDFAEIRRSDRALTIAMADWTTGSLRLIHNQEMTDDLGVSWIKGSASIPGIFPPEKVESQHMVDGGVVMNTPLAPAIAAGADVLHTVRAIPQAVALPHTQSSLANMLHAEATTWESVLRSQMAMLETVSRLFDALGEVERSDRHPDAREVIGRCYEAQLAISRKQCWWNGKPLHIHIYRPQEASEVTPLGLLAFKVDRIRSLVEQGFREAVHHDCEKNGCIFLGRTPIEDHAAVSPRGHGPATRHAG